MQNLIVIALIVMISGCANRGVSEYHTSVDSNAMAAMKTLIIDDKETYTEDGKSAIDWRKMPASVVDFTDKDISELISGKAMYSNGEKIPSLYAFYFILKESNVDLSCAVSNECVVQAMMSGAKNIVDNKNKNFIEKYNSDNAIFKFDIYNASETKYIIDNMADKFTAARKQIKDKEIANNNSLPEKKRIFIDLSNDDYVNKALNIINSEGVFLSVSRDHNGNKYNNYVTPSINEKKIYMSPKIFKWKITNTFKVCEDISVYANVNVTNSCKDGVLLGVKNWIDASKDKNISEMAWRIAAGEATAGDEILFSHWAGMARIHQKRMNERTDKSYYIY